VTKGTAQSVVMVDEENGVGLAIRDEGQFLDIRFVHLDRTVLSLSLTLPRSAAAINALRVAVNDATTNEEVYVALLARYLSTVNRGPQSRRRQRNILFKRR
jgi:hypothetical protein